MTLSCVKGLVMQVTKFKVEAEVEDAVEVDGKTWEDQRVLLSPAFQGLHICAMTGIFFKYCHCDR